MRVIETEWNDWLFRSRTEARHAVFMDTLAVAFDYEPEGYDLDGVWYLPDYFLRQQQAWLEIKGEYPNAEEMRKAKLLAYHSGQRVFISYGGITRPRVEQPSRIITLWRSRFFGDGTVEETVIVDENYAWCQCAECGKFGIAYFPYRCAPKCHPASNGLFETPQLLHAYRAAKQERFEDYRKLLVKPRKRVA